MSDSTGPRASTFNEYMAAKRIAAQTRNERVATGELGPKRIETRTIVTDQADSSQRFGVRQTFIGDHVVVTDSGPDLGGYNAGPSPVELLLASLGGCLAHTFMLQAAARRIDIVSLVVDVAGTTDPRAGKPGFDEIPIHPTDIQFHLTVTSDAVAEQLQAAYEAAERLCPVTGALTQSIPVVGTLEISRCNALLPGLLSKSK